MNAILNRDETTTLRAMEMLIARDGIWKVAIAFVALLARAKRKPRPLYDTDLNAHLRRDLGLPPVHEMRDYRELR